MTAKKTLDSESWVHGWLVAQGLSDAYPNMQAAEAEYNSRKEAGTLRAEHDPDIQEQPERIDHTRTKDAVIHVSPMGGGDGSSPDSPTTLQDAMRRAAEGEGTILPVYGGEYEATRLAPHLDPSELRPEAPDPDAGQHAE